MWINTKTQQVFTLHSEIRGAFPNVSFPSEISEDDLASVNVVEVQQTPAPQYDPISQRLLELPPVKTGAKYVQSWAVEALSQDQIEANQAEAAEAMITACDKALTDHLDATAKTRRYDSRITCAVRAGYPGPFQAEGQAFALWMDTCNALAYQFLAEIHAGTRPMPTSPQQLIDELPTMEWPAS